MIKTIDFYTACVYGTNGDEPGEVQIVLESATKYGITVYRWASCDDSGIHERGEIVLDQEEAIAAGEEYAEENDEELDINNLIQEILGDGEDIRAICKEATGYSQGFLLLPAGEPVAHPTGRMWATADSYLPCKYIRLDATHSHVSYAAHSLLRTIEDELEEEDN